MMSDQDKPVDETKTMEQQRDDALAYARTCAVLLGSVMKKKEMRGVNISIEYLRRFDTRYLTEIDWSNPMQSYSVTVKPRPGGPLIIVPGDPL